jgi:hypothetical protein
MKTFWASAMIVQEMVVTFFVSLTHDKWGKAYKAVRRPFGHVMNSWLEVASSWVCEDGDESWAGTADVEENLIGLQVSYSYSGDGGSSRT